jgi:phosphoserine aminotransferase
MSVRKAEGKRQVGKKKKKKREIYVIKDIFKILFLISIS